MAKGSVSFNQERCKGCGLCVEACPKTLWLWTVLK